MSNACKVCGANYESISTNGDTFIATVIPCGCCYDIRYHKSLVAPLNRVTLDEFKKEYPDCVYDPETCDHDWGGAIIFTIDEPPMNQCRKCGIKVPFPLPGQIQIVDENKFDPVNKPKHYNNSPAKCECGRQIECIDVTRHMGFSLGNIIKYLWRYKDKDGLQGLMKARWYLDDLIKQEENNGN